MSSSPPTDTLAIPNPHAQQPDDVVSVLGTSAHKGLTETQAADRLKSHGRNELAHAKTTPLWRRVLRLLNEPLTYLLFVAIIVSTFAWVAEGRQGAPIDAIVIAAVIVVNTVIGLVQELKAADAVASLKQMTSLNATVTATPRSSTPPTWFPATSCSWAKAMQCPLTPACSLATASWSLKVR